jgi:hypothetical protein
MKSVNVTVLWKIFSSTYSSDMARKQNTGCRGTQHVKPVSVLRTVRLDAGTREVQNLPWSVIFDLFWRIPTSGMLRHIAFVRTNVSKERVASFIKVTRIGLMRRRYVLLKRRFLQEPHYVTSQKTAFLIVTAVKTWNLTFDLFCSRIPRCNFSSVLYPQSCWCIIQVIESTCKINEINDIQNNLLNNKI